MDAVMLAIDVGGTSSRACLVDSSGRVLGHGRNRGGNVASNAPDAAAAAIISAVEAALAEHGKPVDIKVALLAMAGPKLPAVQARLEAAFRSLGLSGEVIFTGDLDALLPSVSSATNGYCIVAGTGAGAVRVRNGEIEAVVDAAGWLLGDLGSGYWLGHHAAIAITADLEGRGPQTALTAAILASLDIPFERGNGPRSEALHHLISAVYAMRPIELARFAPLVIANRGDAVADALLAQAEAYLLADLKHVFDPQMPGPVALGGGIAAHLTGLHAAIADFMRSVGHTPDVRISSDGSVGAIVLTLRTQGIEVDEAMVRTIAASVAEKTKKPAAAA